MEILETFFISSSNITLLFAPLLTFYGALWGINKAINMARY